MQEESAARGKSKSELSHARVVRHFKRCSRDREDMSGSVPETHTPAWSVSGCMTYRRHASETSSFRNLRHKHRVVAASKEKSDVSARGLKA